MTKTYTVKTGDTLAKISILFYGDSNKTNRIMEANPKIKDPNRIFKGQILLIPDLVETQDTPKNIASDDPNEIACKIDNANFKFWTSFRLNFSLDSIDSFALEAPFEKDSSVYREAFRPFEYKDIVLYLGGEVIHNGILISSIPSVSPTRSTVAISGYSKPGILNDVNMPVSSYPIEYSNLNLSQIADNITRAFNLATQFDGDPGPKFDKVAISPTDKPFSLLVKLAQQRGFILSNTLDGKLLFRKTENTTPIASIKEGELPFISCSPSFSPQNYFSSITGLTPERANNKAGKLTVNIKDVKSLRPFTFVADDTNTQNLQAAVNSEVGRMFGSSATYTLLVVGLRAPNGDIWRDGQMISVLSPGAAIYTESKFLIKSAILTRTSSEGDRAELQLVLPEAYLGGIPEVLPWRE